MAACQAAGLLTAAGTGRDQRFFVHRWTATELADRQPGAQLAAAHRQAATYWQWRIQAWPQDQAADVHDLLEARHHLLRAGDTDDATQVTVLICQQLHTWGAWDQEASLIHDTLTRLPDGSADQADWLNRLGIVAHGRGDYDEAARLYQRALDIFKRLGDQARMAASYHNLGMLAQNRGDYDQAARLYERALDIFKRLGDQASMATSYGQLGILAQERGDYDEAARQYQRALDMFERLGDQASMATSYHELGILAQERGDYDQAARHYQTALDIKERLGDQAGMTTSYHQLGILAHHRRDYDQAARHYQTALDISERLGDQAGMARGYHQLGMLAQERGDYDQAARQYQRALDMFERIGNQAGMAASISQLGILEAERGAPTAAVITRHATALAIRLRLGTPQAAFDLRRLAAHRVDIDPTQFTTLLIQATGDTGQAETIMSLLDQLDAATP